eukprot:jgi/Undpi1/2754/HiC_scaffold_14.g06131.m1
MRMKAQCKELVVFAVIPWMGCVQAWGGGRREDRKHTLAWDAFSEDLCRGDCTFASLSDTARVTLPMGQTISKEEYRLACTNSLGDATVGETTIVVTVDKSSFGVEFTLTTKAFAPKGEVQQSVSYPAAFFLAVDLRTNQVTEVRMYAQNIALLAARGYSMVRQARTLLAPSPKRNPDL